MAKPKDSPLFEEPEFDEKEYLSSESERAKGIVIIFVLGALSGLFAGYLQLLGYWELSALLMLAVLVLLTRILTVFRIQPGIFFSFGQVFSADNCRESGSSCEVHYLDNCILIQSLF